MRSPMQWRRQLLKGVFSNRILPHSFWPPSLGCWFGIPFLCNLFIGSFDCWFGTLFYALASPEPTDRLLGWSLKLKAIGTPSKWKLSRKSVESVESLQGQIRRQVSVYRKSNGLPNSEEVETFAEPFWSLCSVQQSGYHYLWSLAHPPDCGRCWQLQL